MSSRVLRNILKPVVIRAMVAREWWQSGVTYNPPVAARLHRPLSHV